MATDRILFQVQCLTIGGAETQVARLAQGILQREKPVAVVSMLPLGPPTEQMPSAGYSNFAE